MQSVASVVLSAAGAVSAWELAACDSGFSLYVGGLDLNGRVAGTDLSSY